VAVTCVIVNPSAGRGRAARLLDEITNIFRYPRASDITLTTRQGDEERLTREAIARDCSAIIVVGGDGTCARVANAILSSPANCSIAVIPCGTGNDFAKTLGVSHWSVENIAALVEQGESQPIDVGHADGYYFLNSCGFGFDASVLEASQQIRFLKGDAVYIYAALSQLFTYRGIDVSPDRAPGVQRGKMLMVAVSNGRFLGGAFKIAPHASVLDGRLDACFFRDANVLERARLFAGALRGTHLGMSSVSAVSVQQLSLTFPEKPAMEMDGELRIAGSRTVEFKCVPRALSVIAAPGALT
jgi:diacylglycerol kinase (ATP)